MARTETIKDFAGRFIAIYEYHDNGDITVRGLAEPHDSRLLQKEI